MKRLLPIALLLLSVAAMLVFAAHTTQALPEYAAQTGEPCASCHASPAGGGIRTARGQAWVAASRPGTVPPTEEALSLLGVKLPADLSAFKAQNSVVVPPGPLSTKPGAWRALYVRLHEFEGN